MALKVVVCVWDPGHTVSRIEAQQRAVRDGTVVKLVKKYGEGSNELRSEMARLKLVSTVRSLDGSVHCPECGALVETVLASEGITDKLEAARDVAQDFDAAIVRTREARSAGEM